jgi:phosphoserine aminotransferase
MGYVVYNTETTVAVKESYGGVKHFKSKGAATRAANKLNREDADYQYAVSETQKFYEEIEYTITQKNMMSGAKFEEKVNTPYYCSPSSEAYWSM